MDRQMKLCSVPCQYLESIEGKRQKRKKISIRERRARGDFISPKAKDQVDQIISGIHKKRHEIRQI